PKLVSSAGCAAHLGARAVTTPWVAKWMMRYWSRSLRAARPVSVKASPVTTCTPLGSKVETMPAATCSSFAEIGCVQDESGRMQSRSAAAGINVGDEPDGGVY